VHNSIVERYHWFIYLKCNPETDAVTVTEGEDEDEADEEIEER